MIIREDEIERIAVDRFTSTTGRYQCLLCSRFERGRTAWDVVVVNPVSRRVIKVVRVAYDKRPDEGWEAWKLVMTAKPEYEEEESGLDMAALMDPYHPKQLTKEELIVKMKPRGARVFVEDIIPVDEVTKRLADLGMESRIDERNKPKPTMGTVLAVGEDPLAQELYQNGDVVLFSKHAGTTFMEDGVQYRSLDLHEIIGVQSREE